MAKNQLVFIALTLLSGFLIPVQAATNTAFSKATGNVVFTSIMVIVVALLSVIMYAIISRTSPPSIIEIKQAPLYGWLGGFIVAFYIIMITLASPRLGVGTAIGLIITGQVIASILIDHFGLFGAAVKSIDIKRAAGALFMILGIYLVMKKCIGAIPLYS
jgi:transporter family-2 protein